MGLKWGWVQENGMGMRPALMRGGFRDGMGYRQTAWRWRQSRLFDVGAKFLLVSQ